MQGTVTLCRRMYLVWLVIRRKLEFALFILTKFADYLINIFKKFIFSVTILKIDKTITC